jgi:RNA recognition motif-containing protein
LDFKKRSRGLAYVKLEDEASLEEALKEVERSHMDRMIKIVRAKPLSETTQRPRDENRPRGERGGRARGGERRFNRGDRKSSESFKRVYKPRHNDENSIYVGNLSFKTTEMRLGRHFESYGEVKDVRIVEDDKERSRGFGYVEFDNIESVEKALVADGSDLDGRKVRVAKV